MYMYMYRCMHTALMYSTVLIHTYMYLYMYTIYVHAPYIFTTHSMELLNSRQYSAALARTLYTGVHKKYTPLTDTILNTGYTEREREHE